MKKAFLAILLFGFITNLLVIRSINFLFLREVLSAIYLLLFPGFLLSLVIKITYKNIWELISYSVSFSIVVLMLLGLGISYLLPYVHITRPLTTLPVLYSLDIIMGVLWVYAFIRKIPSPINNVALKISVTNTVLGLIPCTFPILSIIGAFHLNNGQTNIFTMTMIGIISIFTLFLTIFRNKVSENLFPLTLFMVALSLLFMTSLRGWYITGHDIYLEYFVFQLTKMHGIWKMANFQNPYNACLSITILPTIFSVITHTSDFYIYKVIYQIVFSISIVATYLFIRRFFTPFLAFLGSFAIVSLPTFMTDMPMLNRQEIALLFFVLQLTTLFNSYFSTKIKWFLFGLFGIGLLLSHYSTTYIAVGLFAGTGLIYILFRLSKIHPSTRALLKTVDNKLGLIDNKPNLQLGMVLILLIATIIWNVNITNTATGITQTILKITNDLRKSEFAKAKGDPGSYILLNNKLPSENLLLKGYVSDTSKFVRQFNYDSAFFNEDIYNQYPVTIGSQIKLPITAIGQKLASFHLDAFTLNSLLKQMYAKLIQIFIVIGFVAVFFLRKHIKNFEKEYFVLSVTFFVILVAETILPGGAIDYGILRLFQQGMILFSVPLLIGGLALFSIFDFFHKSIKIYLISFVFIFFFLYLSGFLSTITGGYYPQLNLSNAGFYYDAYYTHTQDISGMDWLSKNRNIATPVQSDWFTQKKIHTYEGFYSIDGLIPSVIRRNSYVYLSVSNLRTGQVIIYANGAPLYYKYDFGFLDSNKNLVYSNGGSKIYR